MLKRTKPLLLLLLVGIVAVATAEGVTYFSYRRALAWEHTRLLREAERLAQVVRFVGHDSLAEHGDALFDTSWMMAAVAGGQGRSSRGVRLSLARRESNRIVFVAASGETESHKPRAVPFDAIVAEPMRRALAGLSGTMIGPGDQGVPVLAAYQPVGGPNWGVVAQIDLARIRAPFVIAATIGGGVGVIAVLFVAVMFFRMIKRLKDSEKQHRLIVEYAHDAHVFADSTGTIRGWNRKAEVMFGWSRQEALGRSVSEIIVPPRYREAQRQEIETFLRTGAGSFLNKQVEVVALHRSGREFPVEVCVSPTSWRGKPAFSAFLRDLTERERVHEMRKSVLRAVANAVVIAERDGRIRWVNPAFTSLTGYSAAEAVGENPRILKSGKQDRAFYQDLWQTILAGEVWRGELVNRRKDGSLYVEEQTITPVRDEQGDISYFIGIKQDISERKHREEETAGLLRVTKDISGGVGLEEILTRIQRDTAAILPCDRVATLRWYPEEKVYRVFKQRGLPPDLLPRMRSFDPEAENVLDLSKAQRLVTAEIRAQQPLVAEEFARYGLFAFMSAPVVVGERLLGALIAANAKRRVRFDHRQLRLLEGIARQLGIALEAAEAYEREREEAEVATALARVGEEMVCSLDTPVLLSRLCTVTSEVLSCDTSHTLLWQREEDTFVPVASHGLTPEEQAVVQGVKVPRAAMAVLLSRLGHDNVAEVGTIPGEVVAEEQQRKSGVDRQLCMALRRGDEIVGIQVAHVRARREPFGSREKRIARGIAQFASIAIDNARLLAEATETSRLKSEFLATISHELRTPLNVIIGYSDLMLEGAFGELPAEAAGALAEVKKSSEVLFELISATLDLARLQKGELPVEMSETHLPGLMHEVEEESRAACGKNGVVMQWNVGPELPHICTDAAKLKVVLRNLINNAVKFTDHGSVMVSAAVCDGGVEFAVADTGAGIPAQHLAGIFEPFRQVDGSATREHGGLGLGLSIVQRLVDLLAGKVTVDSEVGRGSTFRVWIPREPPGSRPEAARGREAATGIPVHLRRSG